MIRVLIVDDQALVRQGFAALLAAQPDFVVVGEAADGAEAVAVAATAPDVVLMDIRMPVHGRHRGDPAVSPARRDGRRCSS